MICSFVSFIIVHCRWILFFYFLLICCYCSCAVIVAFVPEQKQGEKHCVVVLLGLNWFTPCSINSKIFPWNCFEKYSKEVKNHTGKTNKCEFSTNTMMIQFALLVNSFAIIYCEQKWFAAGIVAIVGFIQQQQKKKKKKNALTKCEHFVAMQGKKKQ